MKKILKLIIAFTMVLTAFASVTSLKANAAPSESIQAVVPIDGGGGGVKGAYIRATHNYTRGTAVSEDFFMTVKDAQASATKLGFSAKSFVTWTAIGFIPYIGPFMTLTAGLSDARSLQASKEIRALTDRGKKVQLTVIEDNGLKYFVVREWNGTLAAVKPFQLLVGVTPYQTKRIYK